MTDNKDTLQNIDEQGNINPTYYKNASIEIIEREAERIGQDLTKMDANRLRAFLRECYHALFEPRNRPYCNNACDIPYTTDNISALFKIYLEICEKYACLPSLVGFERYTGLTEDTTKKYLTRAGLVMAKMRGDFVQNRLSESPIGTMGLANNDTATGLLWNRQNLIERETIRQGVNVSDFVQIAQNQSDNESPRLSAI